MERMKITAGLGSLDDYMDYAAAGADELFCGYIPSFWMREQGAAYPLNRREVQYVNVQIGSASELMILGEMVKRVGVPVTIAMNAPVFRKDQYPLILEEMAKCVTLGFTSFILADLGLVEAVYKEKCSGGLPEKVRVHISGELAQVNDRMVRECCRLGADRIIFHRHMTPKQMRCITNLVRLQGDAPAYEAFILNEKCHFHGAFCSSLHCDEFCHICRLPYRMEQVPHRENSGSLKETEQDMSGSTGCGLCALPQLAAAGITHLKVVGRGNYSENMKRDIRLLRRALELFEEIPETEEYRKRMKRELFPTGCSRQCYYPEDSLNGQS